MSNYKAHFWRCVCLGCGGQPEEPQIVEPSGYVFCDQKCRDKYDDKYPLRPQVNKEGR